MTDRIAALMEAVFAVVVFVGYKRCCFVGCQHLWSDRCVPTFQRNLLPPFSGTSDLVHAGCDY